MPVLQSCNIVLQDQYIPIEVTLERRYRHAVETSWGYAEGEAEFARAYAMKGFDEMREETRRVQVPWQEARKQHKRLIVLADPGMGKTALLKMEAVTTALQGQKSPPGRGKGWVSEVIVPLFFRLSEFANTDEEIADAIPRLLERNYPDTALTIVPLIVEKLKNGTCLLLLDALDEVPQEQRNPLAEKLNRFARNYACPIIVTSRIVGYGGGILHDAKEVEIVPFTRKQIDQYIEIWFKNLELDRMNRMNRIDENENNPVNPVNPVKTPDAKRLIHELQQKPQIRGLAQNPLLLSLLCSLYQQDELTLPARRVQIYEQAVRRMLYDWRNLNKRQSTKLALADAPWIEAKLEFLEQLAYQFSCEYKEIFSMRELAAKIKMCKRDTGFEDIKTPDIIRELSEEDGIIQQLDGQGYNARYIFLHRTFQEYLTASYLKRQPNGIDLAKAYFWDFDWHETLILFAGLSNDPELFLNTLLAERDDIFHTLLLLAGKCLAECPQLEMSELIERLRKLWRHDLYHEFVEPTVVAIGQTHERILMHLLSALHNEGWFTKIRVIRALMKIGGEQSIEGLLTALHDTNEDIRQEAATALGRIGDARAVEGLLVALHDTNEDVRQEAATALGRIGDARAVEGLLTALHDTNEDVRQKAAIALGRIGDARAVEGLLTALHDTDRGITRGAATALGRIGDARAVEGLLTALHDTNEDVRQKAAIALGKINDARVADNLVAALLHSDEDIRRSIVLAFRVFVDIGETEPDSPTLFHDIVVRLLTALRDADTNVRRRAAEALGAVGDERAVEDLLVTLHDKDWEVKFWSISALGRIGDGRAVQGLLAELHDQNDGVRLQAAGALGQIGDIRAAEGLWTASNDPNEEVMWEAVIALGQIGDIRAIGGLQTALCQANTFVRRRAASILGQIGGRQVVQSLLTALYDSDEEVREQAAIALGQIGDSEAVQGLLVTLHDPNKEVRKQAATALGQIGDARAVKGLLATLHDWDEEVMEQAVISLGQINAKQAVKGLLSALHHWNCSVREQAAKALGEIGTLDVLEMLLHRLDMDIYDEYIFSAIRQLAITSGRLRPRPACLPIYRSPFFLRLLKKVGRFLRLLPSLPRYTKEIKI